MKGPATWRRIISRRSSTAPSWCRAKGRRSARHPSGTWSGSWTSIRGGLSSSLSALRVLDGIGGGGPPSRRRREPSLPKRPSSKPGASTKRFGRFAAVSGVNYRLREGESAGYHRAQRGGQDHLFHLLTGMFPPRGDGAVPGADITRIPAHGGSPADRTDPSSSCRCSTA